MTEFMEQTAVDSSHDRTARNERPVRTALQPASLETTKNRVQGEAVLHDVHRILEYIFHSRAKDVLIESEWAKIVHNIFFYIILPCSIRRSVLLGFSLRCTAGTSAPSVLIYNRNNVARNKTVWAAEVGGPTTQMTRWRYLFYDLQCAQLENIVSCIERERNNAFRSTVFSAARRNVWAAVDQNCTTYDGTTSKFVFAESAVNCEDKLSSTNCALLYQKEAVAGNDAERDPKCSGDPIDPQLVQAAVDLCPKRCGYCCLTLLSAFHAMTDLRKPRIPCSSVTKIMCENNAWKSILEEDCPKTCGFCD
ncbi:shTK domain protein, partial [Ostertagia ostertagi]